MTTVRKGSWAEGDIEAGSARVHYYRSGRGEQPPVVLAHGFSDNGLCWRRTAQALEGDFDVVMVDARNHGRSSTAAVGVSEMADDLAAVVVGLALQRPAVVGHSIGAATAAEMAARYPDLVARLALEDPPWRETEVEPEPNAQRRLDGVRSWVVSLADMTDDEIGQFGLEQHPSWHHLDRPDWVSSKRQMRVEAAAGLGVVQWTRLIDRITCPTLLIHGDPERDGILTPALADRLARMNPNFTTRSIEGAGHNVRRENFASYIEALSEFLRADL